MTLAPHKLAVIVLTLFLMFPWANLSAKEKVCPPRLQAIEQACRCPGNIATRQNNATFTVVDFVMVTNCLDPSQRKERVACTRVPNQEVTETRNEESRREDPPAGCMAAVNAAKEAGCITKETKAEWECGRTVTTTGVQIPCEVLESLPNECPTPVPGVKETELYEELVGDILSPMANPDEAGFTNNGSQSQGAVTRPSFLADHGLTPVYLDQTLPENKMRLEIPGNFLRYIMSSTVLPWACRELNTSFFAHDITGRSKCDPATLQFQLDPIALAPIENFNRNESTDPACLNEGLTEEEQHALRCDRGELKMRAERTSDGGVRNSLVKLEDGGFRISWHDGIYIKTEEPLRVDLKNDFHLQYTAPQQPSGKTASFDRFGLLVMIPYDICKQIVDWKIRKIRPNGRYVPWAQNFLAHCDNTNPAMGNSANYVIFDPVPRQYMNPALQQYRATSRSEFRVGCNSALRINGVPLAAPNARGEDLFHLLYNRMAVEREEFDGFFDTLKNYGCMGLDFSYVDTAQGKIPSLAAFTLKGRIMPPKVSAAIHNDILNVELPVLISVSEKLKEHVWSWGFGWFLRIIERILSGVLTVMGTYLINMTGLIANKIVVAVGPIDLQIDGVIANGSLTEIVSKQSVGIRRLITNVPDIIKTEITVDISFDACSPKNAWRGPRSLLRLVVGCPLQVGGDFVRLLLGRLGAWILHLDDFLEWIITPYLQDLILKEGTREMTRLTNDSKFAALLDQAQKRALYNSHDMLPEPLSAEAEGFHYSFTPEGNEPEAKASSLPPPLLQACGLAEMALPGYQEPFKAACLLMQTLTGVRTKHFDLAFKVNRIGATTHYRSLTGSGPQWQRSFSSDQPATYYCGFDPHEFSPNGRYLPPSINLLTDFNEIDQIGIFSFGPPLDFTRQCSLFFDLDFVAGIILQGERDDPLLSEALEEIDYTSSADPLFSFKANLTRRSELLINEIFVCESSRDCDPGQHFILERAKRAMCSIIDDMRFEISDGQSRLLSLSLIDAIEDNPLLLKQGLALLDKSDPVLGRRVRQLTDEEKIGEVLEWIGKCPQVLGEVSY